MEIFEGVNGGINCLKQNWPELSRIDQNLRINRIRLAEGFLKRKEFGIWD